MNETRTLDDIQEELEAIARKMLTDAGYDILPDLPDVPSGEYRVSNLPGEKGMTLTLTVVGYSRRYDGWNYHLDDDDWKTILSIRWDERKRKFLEVIKQQGNERTSYKDLATPCNLHPEERWRHGSNIEPINKELKRQRLPYHLGVVHALPSTKNGYSTMLRMFHYPIETGIGDED
jgi:hypothetical protein